MKILVPFIASIVKGESTPSKAAKKFVEMDLNFFAKVIVCLWYRKYSITDSSSKEFTKSTSQILLTKFHC